MAEIVEKISKKLFEKSALQMFCCIPSPPTPPMLVEAYRQQNFILKNPTNSSWPILSGNWSKRSGTSLVSVTAFGIKLYRIKKLRKNGRHDWQCEHEKANINEDALISLKSLFLIQRLFNFLHQFFTFHDRFSNAWLGIPKAHHQFDPFCRRRVASASASFGALFPLVYLSGNLVLTAGDRFRTNYFTKPHFPHHQSEAVHVHLGIVDSIFAAYLWSHVPWWATVCSRYLVFKGGQSQVCHFDLLHLGNLWMSVKCKWGKISFMQLKQNETNEYYVGFYSLIGKSYFPFKYVAYVPVVTFL